VSHIWSAPGAGLKPHCIYCATPITSLSTNCPGPPEVRVVDPVTGGAKGSKPERLDQLPACALLEVGRVAGYGLDKYGQGNAAKGYAYSLSLAALWRHVLAWQDGEDRDPETGRHHLAHAAWHCLTLIAFQVRGVGTDDRGGAW